MNVFHHPIVSYKMYEESLTQNSLELASENNSTFILVRLHEIT